MNERDKELAKQAWTENDWDGHVDIPKLIQLVRADEREANAEVIDKHLKKWASLAGKDKAYKWLEKLAATIRARGNT